MIVNLEWVESILLQLANRFFYEIAVSRVETFVKFDQGNLIFTDPLRAKAIVFNKRKNLIENFAEINDISVQ